MRRVVAFHIAVAGLLLALTPVAGAQRSVGVPPGFERLVFIDHGVTFAARPSADAMSTDFHLLGGHPSWPASSIVHYSVDATGCTNGCTNAVTAVDNAFNAWEISGITFTNGTADTDPCGGTDSLSWTPIDGPGGILAETFVCQTRATHRIVGFQTRFDSGDPWSASGAPGHFDIQATATHEEGHSMGLDHVHAPHDARLTMYPFLTEGDTGFQTLGCGDRLGVNALYGTSLGCIADVTVPLD
jgi:matrixin